MWPGSRCRPRIMKLLKWRGGPARIRLRSVRNARGQDQDSGWWGPPGRLPGGEGPPSLATSGKVSRTRAAGGACDWLRAHSPRADWLFGARGLGPRGRVRPEALKWEAPRRLPQTRGCAVVPRDRDTEGRE